MSFRFGSFLRGKRTGIIFNDSQTNFASSQEMTSSTELHPNRLEPGKRAQSYIAPAFLMDQDDNVVVNIGAAGAPWIMTSTSFVSNYTQRNTESDMIR